MGRILGQEHAVSTLARSLRGGHVHHAWIFHGPFGVGKCTTALEFARLLLDPSVTSAHREAFDAPRATHVARLIDASSHPDLHVIRKERAEQSQIASVRDKKQTNIPIDLLRELMLGGTVDERPFEGAVWRTPYLGHGKVFIIDEAELLDGVGQNALLKTLEEPPPNTYVILVTMREDRLLPTIRSRCQRVGFRPLDDASMRAWVERAALPTLDAAARAWVSRFAEGSPGWASLVVNFGVHEWASELAAPLADLSRGRFVAGLFDDLARRSTSCADAIEKENRHASREAGSRLGIRLLFAVLGHHVREGMREATAANDLDRADRFAQVADAIADADESIRRHLNMKHVLANLVAQWCDRKPMAVEAGA